MRSKQFKITAPDDVLEKLNEKLINEIVTDAFPEKDQDLFSVKESEEKTRFHVRRDIGDSAYLTFIYDDINAAQESFKRTAIDVSKLKAILDKDHSDITLVAVETMWAPDNSVSINRELKILKS